MKIVADNKIPFLKGVLEKYARVVYFPGREISRQHLADADALIVRTRTRCNERLLEGTPVKYIATATIGHDHIDGDYCRARGISWSNAPGCNSGSVMQYLASALAYISEKSGRGFGDFTIGVVGVGHVGRKVERLARTLGMNVLLNDPPRAREEGGAGFEPLDRLIRASDIVTMHVPLNREGIDKTFHMADGPFFEKMKRGGWFINTSRGEVMNTLALTGAMESGRLAGTVIDVWENEPWIDRDLLSLTDIATPHIAGYSLDGKANGTAQSVRAVSEFFGLGIVDWYPEVPEPADPVVRIALGTGDAMGAGVLIGAGANGGGAVISDIDKLTGRLFLHTYDIVADSNRLKEAPDDFERFRDDYPPRREFGAYTVQVSGGDGGIGKTLRELGFRL
ncbi:MAG: 4-phosphoerythronate dehydrogenase [Marinilabiliales bacterium]|nr:MAG: 4-phosphoerythronate dehydrogenase [Marinilabiliales bacterium]